MLGTLVAVLLATAGASRLTADLVLTNQPGTVFMSWEQGSRITVPSVSSARRGEPIATLLTFADCAPNKGGNCDVKMDIRVYDPTGKVYGETKGTEVWVDKAPPPGTTQLAVGYMILSGPVQSQPRTQGWHVARVIGVVELVPSGE